MLPVHSILLSPLVSLVKLLPPLSFVWGQGSVSWCTWKTGHSRWRWLSNHEVDVQRCVGLHKLWTEVLVKLYVNKQASKGIEVNGIKKNCRELLPEPCPCLRKQGKQSIEQQWLSSCYIEGTSVAWNLTQISLEWKRLNWQQRKS